MVCRRYRRTSARHLDVERRQHNFPNNSLINHKLVASAICTSDCSKHVQAVDVPGTAAAARSHATAKHEYLAPATWRRQHRWPLMSSAISRLLSMGTLHSSGLRFTGLPLRDAWLASAVALWFAECPGDRAALDSADACSMLTNGDACSPGSSCKAGPCNKVAILALQECLCVPNHYAAAHGCNFRKLSYILPRRAN